VVATVERLKTHAGFEIEQSLQILGLPRSTYFRWKTTGGKTESIVRLTPKGHYLLPCEREAIIAFKREHPGIGYRRLTYMMLDEDVVATSPATVLRVLTEAGLSTKWTQPAGGTHKKGFTQPQNPHEQWHTDISYLNILGTHYFFMGVLDGFSRAILHHEIRTDMATEDVQIVIQRTLEKVDLQTRPRMITDNGGQYIALDFKNFLKDRDISHSRTRPNHPQSNGKIERFHKSLKQEFVRITSFSNLEEARRLISEYVEEYNTKRLHASLNYLAPADWLKGIGHVEQRLAERKHKLQEAALNRRKQWEAKNAG
jgi:transposase InsO family protein